MSGMSHTTALGFENGTPVRRTVEVPPLGPHDLLVDVHAISVNPVDVKLRTPEFRVLGFDAAGVVREVGTDVSLFTPGDAVYYAGSIDRPGTNQHQHVVDERIVGRMPGSLTFADAASLPLTTITAWESLFDRLCLTPESTGTLLVVGATGGVGSIMLQLVTALLPGVRVIATASDEDRAGWVRSLGATHVVNHREGLAAQVLEIAPQGVEWLFTAHSEGQIETYARIVRPFGEIVAIDDGPRDVSPLKARSISWHWELMFTRPLEQTPDMIAQHHLLTEVAALVDKQIIRPTTTRALTPLSPENLTLAHDLVAGGRTTGKIVLHD